jgi:Rrf2 family protein
VLSRKADYGVRAMVDIARRPPTARTVVSEIAKRQNIPAFYLAKIVPQLARAGLVHTSLGAAGGISLAAPAEEITLLQIIEAIDGPLTLNLCSVDPSLCEEHSHCSVCRVWRQAQMQLNQTLSEMRLSDLSLPQSADARPQAR